MNAQAQHFDGSNKNAILASDAFRIFAKVTVFMRVA